MGFLSFPKPSFLKKQYSVLSLTGITGELISRRFFRHQRQKWEKTAPESLEALLDSITAYDLSRGAGKLILGWLRLQHGKEVSINQVETALQSLLSEMDRKDDSLYDRARSRLLVSKALFYAEGFHWKSGRYEHYQKQILALLRQIPTWKNLSREQVFYGQPFLPEEIIGNAHRMLLMLCGDQAEQYQAITLKQNPLQTDLDYMSLLLTLTLKKQESRQLEQTILEWLNDYRDFKLRQLSQQEKWVNRSLSVLNGKTSTMLGFGLLNGIFKSRIQSNPDNT